MSNRLDLKGKTLGYWSVLEYSHTERKHSYWLCRCVCGNEKVVHGGKLNNGSSTSCGCKRAERFSVNTRKEDRTLHILEREYRVLCRRHQARWETQPITFSEFCQIVYSPCRYCGKTGSKTTEDYSKGKTLVTSTVVTINGIDRIDSNHGYTRENVQPCCNVCNRAKNNMSEAEFLEWINLVYTRNNL